MMRQANPEIPPLFDVRLAKVSVAKGETVELRIKADQPAKETAVVVGYIDSITKGWQATVPFELDDARTATVCLDPQGWMADAVYFIAAIQVDGNELGLDDTLYFEARYPIEKPRSPQALVEKVQQLGKAREALYKQPVGDREAEGVEHFQGVVLVERLLMTSTMFLPGIEIRPTGKGNPAESESRIFDEVMADLLGTDKKVVSGSEWSTRSENSRPICTLMFENVYAESLDEAFALVNARADQVLNLLALNRYAGGSVVGAVITSRTKPPHLWIQLAADGYRGNLAGGPISGEDQHSLVRQDKAAQGDLVLELALSLLRSAHAEQNDDFRYFRYWSILEILADHRVQRGQPVTYLDGTLLLGRTGKPRTTDDAAPRVYQYLKPLFRSINEQSHIQPATSLWEAVRAWYERRNATAHRGGFDPADPRLSTDSPARKTGGTAGLGDEWLVRLRDTVTMALHSELR